MAPTFPHLRTCRAGFELSVLPVWVLDADPIRFAWANEAAVEFWAAASLEELLARDIIGRAPAKVIDRTRHVIERARAGHIERSEWTFYPHGEAKIVSVQLRGINFGDQGFGLLNQALDIAELASPALSRSLALQSHGAVIAALVDTRGRLLTQNASASAAFGDQDSWFAWLEDPREGGRLIAEASKGATVRARPEVQLRGLTRWHEVAASPLRDPVTGKMAVLMEQLDVTEERSAEALADARGQLLAHLCAAVDEELEGSSEHSRDQLRALSRAALEALRSG